MTIIILIIFIAIILGIFVQSGILLGVSKVFKLENPTFRKSLIITIILTVVSILALIGLQFFGLGYLAGIVAFFVFYLLLKDYYQVSWKKILGIYVVMGIFGAIAGGLIAAPIRMFVFEPFVIAGSAMEPTYKNGDYLIIDKIGQTYNRGDVIVFRYPEDPSQFFIKRIVGLPGEKIQIDNNKVIVNDAIISESYLSSDTYTLPHDTSVIGGQKAITLGQDEYFVLGDNRLSSADSRDWGVLPLANIRGKIAFKISSLSK